VPSVARTEDSKGGLGCNLGTDGIQPTSFGGYSVTLHVEERHVEIAENRHDAIELGVGSPVPINAITRRVVHVFARGEVGTEGSDGANALAPRIC